MSLFVTQYILQEAKIAKILNSKCNFPRGLLNYMLLDLMRTFLHCQVHKQPLHKHVSYLTIYPTDCQEQSMIEQIIFWVRLTLWDDRSIKSPYCEPGGIDSDLVMSYPWHRIWIMRISPTCVLLWHYNSRIPEHK